MNTYGLEGRSVDRLLALKKLSDVSKEQYLNSLRQFLVSSRQDPDALVRKARKQPRAFEEEFVAFLDRKGKEASAATLALIRNAVKKLLDVNGVAGIDWARIDDYIPEKRRFGQDRAPDAEEIRRLVRAADLRMKCVVLFLCSSGARVGAIEHLKWRNLKEVERGSLKFAKLTVYAGSSEEYETFLTPEAYRHLQDYKSYRETVGEAVTPHSPVFVTASNVDDFKPERVRGITTDTAKNLLARLQRQLGLREVISEGKNARRYEFKQAHGFRKFFKTRMEMSGVKPIITEMLMGHGIGVSGSYMKPTEQELVEEYSKAIENLTILEKGGAQPDFKDAFREQLLLVVGFAKEEVDRMDLGKVTDEELQQTFRQRLLGAMTNNGNHQKVVPVGEVESYISKGWEYVAVLPDGKAVLKLPS